MDSWSNNADTGSAGRDMARAAPDPAGSRGQPAAPAATVAAATARALVALTKPKIAFASVVTALAAYGASSPSADAAAIFALLGATGLAAAGSLALNQWWERDTDARMARTQIRPLPQGELSPTVALVWSVTLSVLGIAWLVRAFDPATAALAAATIGIYGLLYTPMKRRTRWATEVGSVSGALPPLLGAAAAGNPWSAPAWVLAGILLFWQMPHFYAIGWIHRRDYGAAGLPLLPVVDHSGDRTARWALVYSLMLGGALAAPWALGPMGAVYGIPATLSGAWILARAWRFRRATGDRRPEARQLFRATIFTLPMILLGLVFDSI
jgi:protoheme IX farnesyltransferase